MLIFMCALWRSPQQTPRVYLHEKPLKYFGLNVPMHARLYEESVLPTTHYLNRWIWFAISVVDWGKSPHLFLLQWKRKPGQNTR